MFDFRAIVRTLAQHDVEFAIVGGLAGVMQGAPIHTQDSRAAGSSVCRRMMGAFSAPAAVAESKAPWVEPKVRGTSVHWVAPGTWSGVRGAGSRRARGR